MLGISYLQNVTPLSGNIRTPSYLRIVMCSLGDPFVSSVYDYKRGIGNPVVNSFIPELRLTKLVVETPPLQSKESGLYGLLIEGRYSGIDY